jgi:glycosyltransferase involved in cell wall biosynthesis
VAREAAALAETHDVHVLHLDWQRARPAAGVDGIRHTHVPLSRARLSDYRKARRLTEAAAAEADVVHSHSLTGLLPWLRGRPSARPWVHSEHWSGITARETLSMSGRAALRTLLPVLDRPDVVVAESERLAAAIRRHRSGPLAIVPCVVEPVDVTEWPRDERLRLVGVGGLIARKGPLLAIAATAELIGRGIAASLTWVGDGPLREEAEAEASRLGIADSVTLTGTLGASGVAAALDAANVFVLPTQGDNFCVVAAEALVHGRPIVSGVHTGASDYTDPRVGIFVSEQTASSYADAILAVRRSSDALGAAGVAATVAGRFSRAAIVAGLERAYASAGALMDTHPHA